MRRIDGWDGLKGRRIGEFRELEPGWYAAVILDCRETETPWGAQAVTFFFDINDGEFARYFDQNYKAQTGPDKEWRGTLQQAVDDRGVPYFKGLIEAIEESNPGYRFDFDETKLKRKIVGVGFRREWYEKNGEDKSIIKAFTFCDVKKVLSGELDVPKDKPKKAKSTPAQGYASPNLATPVPSGPAYDVTAQNAPKFEDIGADEELPF